MTLATPFERGRDGTASLIPIRGRAPFATLPAPVTPLIGRQREITAVAALLTDEQARLVTFTGPAGVGKTRLAMAVAQALAPRFGDGVRFISLASVSDPNLVASAIARQLELRETPGRPSLETLVMALNERQALLVLDNFEQIVAAAPIVADLLRACPAIAVLVTSRELLHLTGEHVFPTPPLTLPETQVDGEEAPTSDAEQLFLERARAVKPDLALTPESTAAIAEICRRLDGLPLGIELAAARSALFSPQELLARLSNPLPLLTGGMHDLPERQRALRSSIAWSYDLLNPAEQRLFRRLSVFAGGFSLAAAEAIAAEPEAVSAVDLVASLLNKSLISAATSQEDGESRFVLLVTIREFGLERLIEAGEEAEARRAHVNFCLRLARDRAPLTAGLEERRWLDRLERNFANLRAALDWLEQVGDDQTLLELSDALWLFWYVHAHYREARRRFDGLLRRNPDLEPRGRAAATLGLGWVTLHEGDPARATDLFRESLSAARAADDSRRVALALLGLGCALNIAGERDEAEARLMEALAAERARGDLARVALVLGNLSGVAHARGDFPLVVQRLNEGLAALRGVEENRIAITLRIELAGVRFELGDLRQASALVVESLRLANEIGGRDSIVRMLNLGGRIADAIDQPAAVARLFAAEMALRTEIGVPRWPSNAEACERAAAAARLALGKEAYAEAERAGRAFTVDQAIAEAEALAAACASAGAMPEPDRQRLTRRERDVLRRLIDGKSDREIAEELFIGERTVEWHLANIFGKLGVRSRAAAAAQAVRLGLA